MDIKQLTTQLVGKPRSEGNVIRPSVASSDHAPHTASQLSPQTVKAIQALLTAQQLGKIFDVIVTKVEGGVVSLQIPGAPADAPVLQAEMKSPPPLGTRMTLQLNDDSAKPELKVIAQPNSPQDAVSKNLRLSMQDQKAITPLLANLALLSRSSDKLPADLPRPVLDTVKQLVQQFSHPVQIRTASDIKAALQQTGPYLEANLSKQSKPAQPVHAPPPWRDIQATALALNASEESKKLRLDAVTQTLHHLTRAMQQQPVRDVRANLLRLATIIRATAQQQTLQQNLGIDNLDEMDALTQSINKGTHQSDNKMPVTNTQTSRPGTVPLPSSLVDPKTGESLIHKSPAGTQGSGTQQAYANQQAMPPAVRSQAPQPQGTAQASLINILNTESALDELIGQVEGALARIQVQQLQTAATDQQHRPVWIMELPVRTEQGIDLFDLRIQRDSENHAEDDPKAPWTVSLAFDLEKLGPIRAQVMLYGEDRISTVFWAEKHESSSYFNQHLEKLKSRFKQVGLEVARVDCRCGKPDSPPPSREPRLVDEKV
ncbi:MAG: flagellar hook-length control protein FliK [Gammaproteobacteria bacterium]|nr:flagellar hook-length control protein FliK [Gammaproteobacteria bacterium]